MPRRIPDYPDAFAGWNAVASLGSYISIVSSELFFYIMYRCITQGEPAGSSPWAGESTDALTLEWKVNSPPAFHTFEELPAVRS